MVKILENIIRSTFQPIADLLLLEMENSLGTTAFYHYNAMLMYLDIMTMRQFGVELDAN